MGRPSGPKRLNLLSSVQITRFHHSGSRFTCLRANSKRFFWFTLLTHGFLRATRPWYWLFRSALRTVEWDTGSSTTQSRCQLRDTGKRIFFNFPYNVTLILIRKQRRTPAPRFVHQTLCFAVLVYYRLDR